MINIREMKEDIPIIISFLENTTEDFLHQWGGGRWYKYPVTFEQMTLQFNTRNENTRYYIIEDDNISIGSVELDFINWDTKECTVCRFLISDKLRGQGHGTNSLKSLVKYAFDNLQMKKVLLTVFDFNKGAKKCYEKAGFKECQRETRDNGWVAIKMEVLK